ncbi:hypothetical protein BKP45_13010 [Anaerobacillus alkalidiazotrophicus]|uniref:Uncharacterized protein n=1 Tax=Anaerobacillus alkalidiazotrophicus TaxID=472963 RepID=A0A1S2M192_9BACI|nr:hypothetical protein [Anaerobacillus alkalidiazotrophicus]OIJ18482.1 hypothetical protein BKP45_18725 [Anaerobacillus alkalidiazotrophicus]OIJ19961.1 hypothetical protein BKP45_13010 [Anaerobacillus alkalidiazotrophicus]
MEDNKQQETPQARNFFDELMFGPTAHPPIDEEANTQTTRTEASKESMPTQTEGNKSNKHNSENSPTQEIDFVQMVEQFDQFMGLVNKLGPSLKKMGPLVDLFKSFGSPKK